MIVKKLGFIGAGQMAKAFGLTLIREGLVKSENVSVSCPEESLLIPWKKLGCQTSFQNEDVIENSDTVIWAVKPQVFLSALKNTKTRTKNPDSDFKFHVSFMAGIPLSIFSSSLISHFNNSKIITARVMPNIAMKVGSGCSVYTMGEPSIKENKELLEKLLSSVGLCFEVPESQINAYCGLFSSGIGFCYPILEGLSDGAVKMGIPRDLSLQIAAQTMKGAAELILNDKNTHPGILKDAVCSPAGTTIAGIAKLEEFGIRNALIQAIEAATKRGEELGEKM